MQAPAGARARQGRGSFRPFGGGIGLQALATSDSCLSSFRTRIRAYGTTSAHAQTREGRRKPFSFIRTITVGFGIAPNLLTLLLGRKEGARGLGLRHPYRRWGFPPRPENIGRPEGTTCREI